MHRFTAFFYTLIITIFFFNTVSLAGTKPVVAKKTPAVLRVDTSKIRIAHFNESALNKFKADKDFNYTDGAMAGQPSLWERFWSWLWATLFGWLRHVPYSGVVIKYLLFALAIGLLVYVISKSLGIDPVRIWRGEARKVDVPYSESLENIHEINFDSEIEKAIAQNNYRLAVRLLYLRCLKQLSDTQLIHWQIDKTNSAYIHELTNADQKQTFKLITRQFEYVWYGNFAIDKQAFNNIDMLFQDFKKQLS
jgi:hypothetical protein